MKNFICDIIKRLRTKTPNLDNTTTIPLENQSEPQQQQFLGLKQEVDGIFYLMRKYRGFYKTESFFIGKVLAISLSISVLIFLIVTAFDFFNGNVININYILKITCLILAFTFMLYPFIYFCTDLIEIYKYSCGFVVRETKKYIDNNEIDFIEEVKKIFSISAIIFVMNRLKFGWQDRLSFNDNFIGSSVRKFGFLPCLIVSIYLIMDFFVKRQELIINADNNETLQYFIGNFLNNKSIIIAMIGMSIFCFIVEMVTLSSIDKYSKKYAFLLEQAILLKKAEMSGNSEEEE